MSGELSRITGTAAGGNFTTNDPLSITAYLDPLKKSFDGVLNGAVCRDVYAGGFRNGGGIVATAVADYEIANAARIKINNTGTRLSGFTDANGGILVVQFRFFVRCSSASMTLTPKIYRETGPGFSTVSGAVASSGTAVDFSGSNQKQTITLTLTSGEHDYVPYLAVGGTFDEEDRFWAYVLHDRYISF